MGVGTQSQERGIKRDMTFGNCMPWLGTRWNRVFLHFKKYIYIFKLFFYIKNNFLKIKNIYF